MIRFDRMSFLVFSVCCTATATVSAASELLPIPLRDPGKVPESRVRQLEFKGYSHIGVYHSVPCKVRFIDKFFGYLDDETYYRNGKMPLQSACYEASYPEITADAPVRFDPVRNEWVRDMGVALRRWGTGEELRPEEVNSIDASIRTYPLNNINSRGFAYTEEDWTGDERDRRRHLEYCLFREGVALCGSGEMKQLGNGTKKDLTKYILEILRSIEFVSSDENRQPCRDSITCGAPTRN